MIIIDSVAALFRLLSDKTRLSSPLALAASPCVSMDYAERSAQLYRMSSLLSRIASQCACWLVTTNQVTANMEAGVAEGHALKIRPALGLAWSNCVCCRIMLRRNDDRLHQQEGEAGRQTHRTMQVVYAPHVSPTSPPISFSIGGGGVGAYVGTTLGCCFL
eukprot:GHVS01105497.1.p1 GENE.GHVS01105497.1~~GHVS01105497.1.p1  ORF type:complete len:161 (+),score=14.85 GHVS01105497.1:705-1187(+)